MIDRRGMRGRLGVPLGIGAVFAAPLALALALYARPDWRPPGTLAQGELLHPASAPGALPLRDTDGNALGADLFRGRWTLLLATADGCPPGCRQLLDTLSRVCRAQAEGTGRLQRVLVAGALSREDARSLALADPGLRIALTAKGFDLRLGQVYLIDPHGNPVLRYPPGFAPAGLARDLARLLRLSWIG